ncbi:MAG TPA: hypothetical protein VJB63_00715 [Patescibacteria group bacterium]|nr:hypothetical protein [Patescibacteria group bacterium]
MDNQTELSPHTPISILSHEKEYIKPDLSIQTMEKQKAILKKNPTAFKIQQIFAKSRIVFGNLSGGIFQPSQIEYAKNHLEDGLALIHYLETNVMDVKDSAKQTEKPYKASLNDLIRFSLLVGKQADPVEILERMRQIGITFTVSDLKHYIGILVNVTSSTTSIEGLKQVAQNNIIKKLFYKEYGREKSELYMKNVSIFSGFEWEFFTEKKLLNQIASLNNDYYALALLQLKESELHPWFGYNIRTLLKNVNLLQRHHLVKDLLQGENAGLSMYDFNFLGTDNYYYQGATQQLVEKTMQLWEISNGVNNYSPEGFIEKLTSIKSSALLPKELEIYKPFINAPQESAIILTICNELGFDLYKSIVHISLVKKEITKARALKDSNIYELYKNIFIQQACLDFLYEGDVAHDILEKIKEKNWITIQTYNRLYAARRKHIGYESYAYRPQKGDNHPVINVTFYKDQIPEHIQRYEKNYALYEKTMEESKQNKTFIKNFRSWYDEPKKFPSDSERELVTNYALPIGISTNGHTHYYATPYGIVSGCIAENRKDELVEKDFVSSIGLLGVQLVSGHKKMLADFLRSQGSLEKARTEHIVPENAVTIDFDTVLFPSELKQMILPPHITVSETLLNLHMEQYLHDMTPDEQLLTTLMKNIEEGHIQVLVDEKQIDINTILDKGQKMLLKKKI